MKQQPYPKYKDSGVEWLGKIPEHWETWRLKTVSRFAYGDSLAADNRVPGDYDVFGSNGVIGQHNMANTQGPCLIIGRKGSFEKVVYSERPCFAIDTTFFVDASQTSNNLRWLFYCLQWLRLDSFSKDSAVPGLAREDAYENPVPYCLPDEQHTIAAFLDRETAHIDTLIVKKERQIELLQEKRAALISHAVTKGLDPTVPMKDSGVEWLGNIPEGFRATRLKRAVSIIDGDRGKEYPNENDFTDEGIPFLSSKNIVDNRMNYSGLRFINTEKFDKLGRGKLEKGDLVITVRGTIGSVGCFTGEEFQTAFINAQMMILRPSKGITSSFLHYVAQSEYWLSQLDVSSYGTAQQQLSNEILSSLRIALPTVCEQENISAYLDRETGRIDTLIAKTRESIERLQEYRTALISAAVTGKIDVR